MAIDTSAGTSVAVSDSDGTVLFSDTVRDTMRHAEVVGDSLVRALAEAGVTPLQITGVVAGIGPGPFTGLRVGLAAAQTFAFARGIPLLPVISHDAAAFDFYRSGGTGPILITTDARRKELYWSAYDPPVADSTDGIASGLGALPVRVGEPGLSRPDDLPHPERTQVAVDWIDAGSLATVAATVLASGGELPAFTALYLRSPDATVPGAVKRVSQ